MIEHCVYLWDGAAGLWVCAVGGHAWPRRPGIPYPTSPPRGNCGAPTQPAVSAEEQARRRSFCEMPCKFLDRRPEYRGCTVDCGENGNRTRTWLERIRRGRCPHDFWQRYATPAALAEFWEKFRRIGEDEC